MKKENNTKYRMVKINVTKDKNPEVFKRFELASSISTEIYNKALFVLRQNYTAHQKDKVEWSENENEIYNKIVAIEKLLDKNGEIPWVLDNFKMQYFFDEYETYADEYKGLLPYSVIRAPFTLACQDFKAWNKEMKSYFKNPSKFRGKPHMPNYKEKGVSSPFSIIDARGTLKNKDGEYFLTIPNCKEVIELNEYFDTLGSLQKIEISKKNKKTFLMRLIFKDTMEHEQVVPKYFAGIDLGINNVMTVVSNCERNESLIFNGKQLKTINQWYNKQYAKLSFENTKGRKAKKGENNYTQRMRQLTEKRNNQMNDQIHKISKTLIEYCLENQIGTIVIGENKEWKQETNIGKRNNQNFVQIPFEKLKSNIEYRAKRHGIKIIRREESYTSKADYLAKDYMPNEHKHDFEKNFSGRRVSRGMYKSGIGVKINADCNGAANILRKEFPEIEIPLVNFENIRKFKKFI